MAANFCMNCGSRLEPGARVCPNCGEPVPQAHEAVNPLKSGAIPTVMPGSPVPQAADAGFSAEETQLIGAPVGNGAGAWDNASPQSSTADAENGGFNEDRTQLIGVPPVAAGSPRPSEAEREREEFHQAEIKSGTWNESSPASYRMDATDSDAKPEFATTRVIGWTNNAPDGTCTVPFASRKPEAADLFEPPEADLSGFDVPAEPRYDLEDDSVAAWGTASPDQTFVAGSTSGNDGWEDDRPAGYTGGLKPEPTTQMPSSVDPMAGVKRSDTMVMDPITAQSVYTAPRSAQTTYSSENTARRGSGTKVAAIVIGAVLVFAIIYLVQFNPYFLQNIQYDLSQWAQNQGLDLLGGIYDAFAGIVDQIALLVR